MEERLQSLFQHPSKPNTRLPPIAHTHCRTPSTSTTSSDSSDSSDSSRASRLAALSKTKLHQEAAAPDPDLRRCVGHHRLLRRSMQEAHEDMQRYLASLRFESDTESDGDQEDDDMFDDDRGDNDRVLYRHHNCHLGDDGDDEKPKASVSFLVQRRKGYVGKVKERKKKKKTEVPLPSSSSPPSPSPIRNQIAGAVRMMVRRRTSALSARADADSCTGTGQYGKGSDELVRVSRRKSWGDERTQMREDSMTSKGRRYVERLGFRRRCPPCHCCVIER